MKTRLLNRLTRAFSLSIILAILLSSLALADQISGDADALALNAPHGNQVTATQASGTTADYDFSAYIKETGNAGDNVFPGTVHVIITPSGDWSIGVSPNYFDFTAYDIGAAGHLQISVPCGAQGTSKTMTIVLQAGASSNGKTLNPDSVTLTYVITAGPNDTSCTPSDTTAPTADPTQNPAANPYGWNNTDVTVTWNWSDNEGGSGIDIANCTTSNTSLVEGTIRLSASCKDMAGNTGSASYTVYVDKTAPTADPTQSPTANSNGWNNSDVNVTWNWSDNAGGSDIDGTNCTTSSTSSGEGTLTLNATCSDLAGNPGTDSYIVNVDKTKPTISANATTLPNSAGWYNSNVIVKFNCLDDRSGVPNGTCPADQILNTEGLGISSTAQTVTDAADNTSLPSNVVIVNIDKTAPTITDLKPTASPNGSNGWYKTAVINQFRVSDSLSGIVGHDSPYDFQVSSSETEGSAVTVNSGSFSDVAGNTNNGITSAAFKIDLTNPYNIEFVEGPSENGSYILGAVPSEPTCTAVDDISGLDTCVVSGYSNAIGTHTMTATATDKAGRTATATRTYTVSYKICALYDQTKSHKAGSTVPVKLQLCDNNGVNYSSASVVVKAVSLSKTDSIASPTIDDSGNANPDNNFRYDATLGTTGGYIYNLSTKGFPTGTYKLSFTVDGTPNSSYAVQFDVK